MSFRAKWIDSTQEASCTDGDTTTLYRLIKNEVAYIAWMAIMSGAITIQKIIFTVIAYAETASFSFRQNKIREESKSEKDTKNPHKQMDLCNK